MPLGALEAALAPALGGVPLHFESVPGTGPRQRTARRRACPELRRRLLRRLARRVIVRANYYFNRISNLLTPLIQQVGTELGRINPVYGPYQPPSALNAAQQALVLASLQAVVPPSILPFMSNDLDGSPIFAVASYTNFARVNMQGAEISVQIFRSDGFVADVGYSALSFAPQRTCPKTSSRQTRPRIRLRPARRIRTNACPRLSGIAGQINSRGAMVCSMAPISALHVVDASASVKVGPRTTLLVNAANLFDNSHYQVFGRDLMGRRSLVGVRQAR